MAPSPESPQHQHFMWFQGPGTLHRAVASPRGPGQGPGTTSPACRSRVFDVDRGSGSTQSLCLGPLRRPAPCPYSPQRGETSSVNPNPSAQHRRPGGSSPVSQKRPLPTNEHFLPTRVHATERTALRIKAADAAQGGAPAGHRSHGPDAADCTRVLEAPQSNRFRS